MMETMDEINLNKDDLFLHRLPNGITSIPIVADGESWWCDVKKNSGGAMLEFYRRFNRPRNEYSKHDENSDHCCIWVDGTALISINFFRERNDISRAQDIYSKFSSQLAGH